MSGIYIQAATQCSDYGYWQFYARMWNGVRNHTLAARACAPLVSMAQASSHIVYPLASLFEVAIRVIVIATKRLVFHSPVVYAPNAER